MSLVQHVSVIDGVDCEPEPADLEGFEPIRRKLSYDVFIHPPLPPDEDKSGVAQYKVPTVTRGAQVLVTVLACAFASGIVFGFAAFKPVMVAEGVYSSLCADEELQEGADLCQKQDIMLNFFFTVASITTNMSALPVGTILDRYGSHVCGFAGCTFLAIGCLLMAYCFANSADAGYTVGNFFLALGGTFIFVPSFQVANTFPKHAGTIVALVTGAFDASAAVYLLYRMVWEATERRFTPDKFFLGYLVVPALIFVSLVTFMPKSDYKSVQQLEAKIKSVQDPLCDVHEFDEDISDDSELRLRRQRCAEARQAKIQEVDEVIGDESERKSRLEQEEERQATAGVWGALHGKPAHQQMATPWFILITLMTVMQMLRMNYFIATIRAQYEYMLDDAHRAIEINHFFDVALPVVGMISTPFIGFLLDHFSVPAVLGVIVLLTTAVGAVNSIPAVWAGYCTVVLFVTLRPLYYSAMSDYTTKVFGFTTFGRVYGSIICLSGLFSFSQYGLDALTHGPLDGNPIPINAAFAIVGFVVGTALVTFVYIASQRMRAKQSEDEAEERRWLFHEVIPEEE
ncbi:Mfs transporter [Aspergillus sp. HF37]|nr:Mfs transporter [Aspergillus sp. HF37]